jgi:hypothetical protein
VRGTGVDLELAELLGGEPVAGTHALDRLAKDLRGPALELLGPGPDAQPARVAGVTVVLLLLELVAGDGDLLRVDDDDEVAGVDVRRVLGLPLAAERVGDARGESPEVLALGVDDVPAPFDPARVR